MTLIERNRSHVWKPRLHEIAAGSMDIDAHDVNCLAQAHWHHFRCRIGEMVGLDRERREVQVAAHFDGEGRQVTPARRVGYDTLVIAVGSQSNDFGTPGVAEHALKLESADDARPTLQTSRDDNIFAIGDCATSHAASPPSGLGLQAQTRTASEGPRMAAAPVRSSPSPQPSPQRGEGVNASPPPLHLPC